MGMDSEIGKHDLNYMVLGHTNFNTYTKLENNMNRMSMYKLVIPGSEIFRVGYVDGGSLRLDTRYSWRRSGEEMARPGIYQQMWKLDKEGNLTSIRQGHAYCSHCDGVKQLV